MQIGNVRDVEGWWWWWWWRGYGTGGDGEEDETKEADWQGISHALCNRYDVCTRHFWKSWMLLDKSRFTILWSINDDDRGSRDWIGICVWFSVFF